MYFDSMFGLSNFKTQKLAQQSQICHRNAWFIASFKEAISFFELPVIRRSSTYNTIIMNQLQIDIRIRLASNKTK